MKPLTTFGGLKKGQKFTVISNCNSHNYPLNVPLTLERDGLPGSTQMDQCAGTRYNTLDIRDVVLIDSSITELKAKIEDLHKEEAKLIRKIKLCEEFGVTTFDDRVLDVYEALRVASSAKSNKEKAIIIKEQLFDK